MARLLAVHAALIISEKATTVEVGTTLITNAQENAEIMELTNIN
ncbi:hypothetical protein [Desulfosporosinus sp. BG]|nr:hypothetical protein [Desulfosporosinus sp. BG]